MVATFEILEQGLKAHQVGNFDLAESMYRRVMAEHPTEPNAPHLLGVLKMQRGEPEAAVESIGKAIDLSDKTALFHSNLGTALRDLNRVDEAVTSFRRSIELDPSFAGGHFNLALAFEQQNEIGKAVEGLKQVIGVDPAFAAAYLNLGRILSANGRPEESIEWLRRGISVAPESAEMQYNFGNALAAFDRTDEAITAFREAIRLNPKLAQMHNNLGAVLKKLERWDEAAECFETAVRLDEKNIDARFNLAGVRRTQGRTEQALDQLRVASELQPDNVDVMRRTALILQDRNEIEPAAEILQRAVELQSEDADLHFLLADNSLSRGLHELAKQHYEIGLQLDMDNSKAWVALGLIDLGEENYEQAEDCFRSALIIDPENEVASYNLGNLYKDLWRLDDALDCYDRAIELDAEFAEAFINRGGVLKSLGRLDEAVENHTSALAVRPGDAEARFHRSLAMLANGNFERGWAEYESRWEYEAAPRFFALPVWDGSPLTDRRLLIYSEQGIGDEILFASCLPEISGHTADCVVECDPRLVPLFARSFPMVQVVSKPIDLRDAESRCDLQIAAGSLPRHCRRDLSEFPNQRRFLVADAARIQEWKTRFAALGDGLNVGISWRGGNKPAIRKSRSTTLDQWMPLLETPGVDFINLQYGDCTQELEELRNETGVTIHDWEDAEPLRDLDGFAAQISALDLVISIDNSTVHMAGALGVPVWTLLPFAPNWRWMLNRDDSPWYPSMRLFRQTEPMEWESVFTRVADELPGLRESAAAEETSSIGSANDEADMERRKYEHIWSHDIYRKNSMVMDIVDKISLIPELRKRECRSVLDAGCGSGKLMQRLMTQHAGEFDVHGFDISGNCLDPCFDGIIDDVLTVGCLWNRDDLPGKFDAVICTDVMEHIPTDRVPAVLENLRHCTRKLAYIAIALFPDGFGPMLIGEPLHLTVKPPGWWFAKLGIAGFQIQGQAVEKNERGEDRWLHVLAGAGNAND